MKSIIVLFLTSTILLSMDVSEIVRKSDEIRNIPKAFFERGHIVQYRNARKVDSMTLDVYAKEFDGGYKTLVKILSPKKDKNKLMLRDGNKMWIYDPSSKATAQMSPQQRLMGQSSSSDVMSANFVNDYKLKLMGIETVKNGEKKQREAYKIVMHAKSTSVSYSYVEYWVDKVNFRPIRAKFYSVGKDLLKTSYYRKFKDVLGKKRPTQVLIIDGVDGRKATTLDFSDARQEEISNSWFKKSYLPKFIGK